MNLTTKIALGLGGAALALSASLALANMANADASTSNPTPVQTCAGYGHEYGRTAEANPDSGLRNGAGYGAADNVAWLADQLDVSAESISAALATYHAGHPATTRGRDMTVEQKQDEHNALAEFLADELKVDKTKVLEALNAKHDARQAERQASHPSGMGGHGRGGNR